MRSRNTIEYLGIWETLYNYEFKTLEFEGFRKEADRLHRSVTTHLTKTTKLSDLNEIKANPKTGAEKITYNGTETEYNLLDFWRWSVSDVLSNVTRGRFAEFIVGTALGINPLNLRDEWDAFDLTTDDGIKIEVKSASYIQSWNQNQLSKISFSIKKSRYWDDVNNMQRGEPKRHADLYVLCHLKHIDQATIDPLKMEQWDFYVLPTFRLDNYERSQSSITINSLRKLTQPIKYSELKTEIEKAYIEQKTCGNK